MRLVNIVRTVHLSIAFSFYFILKNATNGRLRSRKNGIQYTTNYLNILVSKYFASNVHILLHVRNCKNEFDRENLSFYLVRRNQIEDFPLSDDCFAQLSWSDEFFPSASNIRMAAAHTRLETFFFFKWGDTSLSTRCHK